MLLKIDALGTDFLKRPLLTNKGTNEVTRYWVMFYISGSKKTTF